jgi:hypothetical protein
MTTCAPILSSRTANAFLFSSSFVACSGVTVVLQWYHSNNLVTNF